jgi:hypothetical protein
LYIWGIAMPESRHIPIVVQRQLRDAARDRCCICARLLPPEEIPFDIEREILDQHHILYFSEGGEHTEENLLLACPNCHRRVHAYPDRYRPEQLRYAKRFWKMLKDLVPPRLHYEGDDIVTDSDNMSDVRFHVVALNLDYTLRVPISVTMIQLARFVTTRIMHPLVTVANLAPYDYMFGQAQLSRMGFATKSYPQDRLSPFLLVADLRLADDDSLVALVDFNGCASRPRDD